MADDADASARQLTAEDSAAPVAVKSPGDQHGDVENADEAEEVADRPRSGRATVLVGTVLVVILTALTGWLGWQYFDLRTEQAHRDAMLQAARQGAINLTTIDYQQAGGDIQRILDGSTGAFHDDFQLRATPFIETVKKAQSASVGTVTLAGLESWTDREAQALLSVTVKTSLAGVEQLPQRAWRMRINVENVGTEAKVSNVAFIP